MDAFTLKHLRGLYALPGRGDFDEHPLLRVYPLCLIQLGNASRPCQSGIGVKAQTGIDFGGHTPRQQGQQFHAKAHQQTVHGFIQRHLGVLGQGLVQQGTVHRHLHRFEDERGVGGGVSRLKLGDLLEVAGVCHHGGELL